MEENNCAYDFPQSQLVTYTCYRTPEATRIDGNLDRAVWKKLPKSSRSVDLVSGKPGFLDTRMAAAWHNDFFIWLSGLKNQMCGLR